MTWQGKGSTTQWRRTRERILRRDNRLCQIRGPKCTTLATQVHHTLGRGVSERDDHLMSACAWCNNWIGEPKKDPDVRPRTNW